MWQFFCHIYYLGQKTHEDVKTVTYFTAIKSLVILAPDLRVVEITVWSNKGDGMARRDGAPHSWTGSMAWAGHP